MGVVDNEVSSESGGQYVTSVRELGYFYKLSGAPGGFWRSIRISLLISVRVTSCSFFFLITVYGAFFHSVVPDISDSVSITIHAQIALPGKENSANQPNSTAVLGLLVLGQREELELLATLSLSKEPMLNKG